METILGGLAFACLIAPSFLLSSLYTKHAGKAVPASVMTPAATRVHDISGSLEAEFVISGAVDGRSPAHLPGSSGS